MLYMCFQGLAISATPIEHLITHTNDSRRNRAKRLARKNGFYLIKFWKIKVGSTY